MFTLMKVKTIKGRKVSSELSLKKLISHNIFLWHTPNEELSKFTEKLKYIWCGGADIIVYIFTPTLGPIELLS